MRNLLAAAVAVWVVGPVAQAAPLEEAWRVDGLARPYSAVFDANRNVVFVSSEAGDPLAKDGNGFISRIGFKGGVLEREWATGLNAPKGMSALGDRLYVADIDEIVAIDLLTGAIAERWAVPGAQDLTDVYAAQRSGRVFVSDPATDSVWVLKGGKLELFAQSPDLSGPTGLRVNEGRLVVAGAGHSARDGAPARPGRLTAIALDDARIWPLGENGVTGELAGLEAIGDEGWYVTDPSLGMLYRVDVNGQVLERRQLPGAPTDLAYQGELGFLLVPLRDQDGLAAYAVERSDP
jgi:hypothetical protein